jgi:hypothetical protein
VKLHSKREEKIVLQSEKTMFESSLDERGKNKKVVESALAMDIDVLG